MGVYDHILLFVMVSEVQRFHSTRKPPRSDKVKRTYTLSPNLNILPHCNTTYLE